MLKGKKLLQIPEFSTVISHDKKKLAILGVIAIVIIALAVLFATGFFEPKIPALQLATGLGVFDDKVQESSTVVPEFEKIKNISNFDELMITSIIKTIDESASVETPTIDEEVTTTKASLSDGKIMVLKFENLTTSSKYLLALESNLLDMGYYFEERLKYEDLSSHFTISGRPVAYPSAYAEDIYILQKGSYLIILSK